MNHLPSRHTILRNRRQILLRGDRLVERSPIYLGHWVAPPSLYRSSEPLYYIGRIVNHRVPRRPQSEQLFGDGLRGTAGCSPFLQRIIGGGKIHALPLRLLVYSWDRMGRHPTGTDVDRS